MSATKTEAPERLLLEQYEAPFGEKYWSQAHHPENATEYVRSDLASAPRAVEGEIATVKKTNAGPELFICGVEVCCELGTDNNKSYEERAAKVNEAYRALRSLAASASIRAESEGVTDEATGEEKAKASEILGPYRAQINGTPELLSLLYDVDLLPEQIISVARYPVANAIRCVAMCCLYSRAQEPERLPQDGAREAEFVEIVGSALDDIIAASIPMIDDAAVERRDDNRVVPRHLLEHCLGVIEDLWNLPRKPMDARFVDDVTLAIGQLKAALSALPPASGEDRLAKLKRKATP